MVYKFLLINRVSEYENMECQLNGNWKKKYLYSRMSNIFKVKVSFKTTEVKTLE